MYLLLPAQLPKYIDNSYYLPTVTCTTSKIDRQQPLRIYCHLHIFAINVDIIFDSLSDLKAIGFERNVMHIV